MFSIIKNKHLSSTLTPIIINASSIHGCTPLRKKMSDWETSWDGSDNHILKIELKFEIGAWQAAAAQIALPWIWSILNVGPKGEGATIASHITSSRDEENDNVKTKINCNHDDFPYTAYISFASSFLDLFRWFWAVRLTWLFSVAWFCVVVSR